MDLQKIVGSKSGPSILCASVDQTLKPKIKIFQDFCFSKDDITCIVSDNPWLLLNSVNKIFPSLLVLWNVLGSVDLVAKLLKVSAWFTAYDLDRTLIPNIEFLKSCGFHVEQLNRYIFKHPRLFLLKPERLKKSVEKVDEMKFRRELKMYFSAIVCLGKMSEVTWEKNLELLGSFGFTQDQMFQMFQKAPLAFLVSQGKIREVLQVINASSMYDLSDIVRHPRVLSSSVETRLKPRLQVLEILKSRNLIAKYPGFLAVYKSTDKDFTQKFVTPYLDELGDTYLANNVTKKDVLPFHNR